jgi:hypothetical protein
VDLSRNVHLILPVFPWHVAHRSHASRIKMIVCLATRMAFLSRFKVSFDSTLEPSVKEPSLSRSSKSLISVSRRTSCAVIRANPSGPFYILCPRCMANSTTLRTVISDPANPTGSMEEVDVKDYWCEAYLGLSRTLQTLVSIM